VEDGCVIFGVGACTFGVFPPFFIVICFCALWYVLYQDALIKFDVSKKNKNKFFQTILQVLMPIDKLKYANDPL
jgi:hypothetical protein